MLNNNDNIILKNNGSVILSETQCTWGPHKITFLWGILWGIRKNLKLCSP